MKTLKYILSTSLFVGIVYLFCMFLFNISFFQKKIAHKASEVLEKKIGTFVHIETISIKSINKLIFRNVCLKDQLQNTLFSSKKIFIKLDILSIFKHKLKINTAYIDTFSCHLTKENTRAPLNISYIIEIIKKYQHTKKNINIYVQKIFLKNGTIYFKIKNKKTTSNRFNPYDVQIRQINTIIQLEKFTNENLIAKIIQMHLIEKSGFKIQNLSFNLSTNNHCTKISKLILFLPNSYIRLKEVIANYSTSSIHKRYTSLTKINFKIQVNPSKIYFNDLSPFIPSLINSNDNLYFNTANIKIYVKNILLKHCNYQGNIDLSIKKLRYLSTSVNKINLIGNFNPTSFKGLLKIDSKNWKIKSKVFCISKEKISKYRFFVFLNKVNVWILNLGSKNYKLTLSGQVNASIIWNSVKNFTGNITFRKLNIYTNNHNFHMDSIKIETIKTKDNNRKWIAYSDLFHGSFEGLCSVKSLWTSLKYSISMCFPSFIIPNKTHINKINTGDFQCNLTIHNSKKFSKIFHIPIFIHRPLHITFKYKKTSASNKFYLNIYCPLINVKNYIIENGIINITNKNIKGIKAFINGTFYHNQQKNKSTILYHFKAYKDSIYSKIKLKNNINETNFSQFNFITHLFLSEDKLFNVLIKVNPSKFINNNLIWEINPTIIVFNKKHINIKPFTIKHNKQTFTIKNYLPQNRNSSFRFIFSKINLNDIFKSLNLLEVLNLEGIVDGQITIQDIFHTKKIYTNLHINQFSLNQVPIGNLYLIGQWKNKKHGIKIIGQIKKDKIDIVFLNGFINPFKNTMSIFLKTYNTNISFLRKYLNKSLSNFSGQLTGKVHLFGSFIKPTINGTGRIQNGQFGIKTMNTNYNFNSLITCTNNKIYINNLFFYDKYGNQAFANGCLHHNSFKHFQFNADVTYNNILIFNENSTKNPSIYGNVFASGKGNLRGNEKFLYINALLNNEENSHLFFNFSQSTKNDNYDSIKIVQKKINVKNNKMIDNNSTNTKIKLNLIANINNKTTLEIITDQKSKNKIISKGNGILEIKYETKTPLKIFGKYTIEKGRYNYNFKSVLPMSFNILKGSFILFRGDPTLKELDIRAHYSFF